MKLSRKNIIIIIAIVAAIILLSKKGKIIYKKVKDVANGNTEVTIDILWKQNSAAEFTKEVWFDGQLWQAQVKNIKGNDVALLANNKVVIYDNDVAEWMPAGMADLKTVNQ